MPISKDLFFSILKQLEIYIAAIIEVRYKILISTNLTKSNKVPDSNTFRIQNIKPLASINSELLEHVNGERKSTP
jgi:hypothetical protein